MTSKEKWPARRIEESRASEASIRCARAARDQHVACGRNRGHAAARGAFGAAGRGLVGSRTAIVSGDRDALAVDASDECDEPQQCQTRDGGSRPCPPQIQMQLQKQSPAFGSPIRRILRSFASTYTT